MNLEVGSGNVSLFLVHWPLVLVFAAHKIVESFSHSKSRRQTDWCCSQFDSWISAVFKLNIPLF